MAKTEKFIYTEEVTGEIVNIPISLLHHHHQNPRKDFGDLTELADSITQNGIFQNLTVVPFWFDTTGVGCDYPEQQAEMGYLVVIGNRRLEAAKIAGLNTLPCIISNMSHKEQLSTMLAENMQRSDLTVYEQAQGFQMMIDLGDSIEDISKISGFSESTIRRRVKLSELDQEKLKEVTKERQISMADFEKLNKIKDIETRNKLLKDIGTYNFEFSVNREIQAIERKEKEDACRKVLIEKGLKELKQDEIYNGKYCTGKTGGYISVDLINDEFDIKDAEFFLISYGSVYFKRLKTQEELNGNEPTEEEKREAAKREERFNKLDELEENLFALRSEFIKNLTPAVIKNNLVHITTAFIHLLSTDAPYIDEYSYINEFSLFNEDDDDNEGFTHDDVYKSVIASSPEIALLKAVLVLFNDCANNSYRENWSTIYRENERLDILYTLLISLGYKESDEEKLYRSGKHELFETN